MDDHLQIQGQDGFVEHDGLKRSCLFTEPGESLVNGWPDDHRKVLSATGTGQQIGQEGMIHQKQDGRVRIGVAQRRREDGLLVVSYRLPQGALPVREMQTPELTRALEEAVESNAPPAVMGRRIKLRYAHQGGNNPPVIVVHGNQTDKLATHYKRYLANQFREKFKLKGVPLALVFKTGDNPFKDKKNELTARQIKKKQRLVSRGKKRGR